MYALVQFSNDSYFICTHDKLRMNNGNTCVARYKGANYGATIKKKSDKYEALLDYQSKLENACKEADTGLRVSELYSSYINIELIMSCNYITFFSQIFGIYHDNICVVYTALPIFYTFNSILKPIQRLPKLSKTLQHLNIYILPLF